MNSEQSNNTSKQSSSQPKKLKKIGSYSINLNCILGKGAFSTVYKASQEGGIDVACKEISNETLQKQLGSKAAESLDKELGIIQKLRHKNIVQYVTFLRTGNNNYIFMEFCGGGDLRTFLKEKRRLTEAQAQKFMYQIGQALKYLYQNSIVHRDLKLQNILLSDKTFDAVIKLADFGLARQYQTKEDLFETTCGTPIYMAPEIQKGDSYDEKADLWSVGVILFELIAGFPPFNGRSKDELKQNIAKGQYAFPPGVQPSMICTDLMKKLLISDSSKRIDWLNFFEHPFIKSLPQYYESLVSRYDTSQTSRFSEEIKIEENDIQNQDKVHQKPDIKQQQKQEAQIKPKNRYQEQNIQLNNQNEQITHQKNSANVRAVEERENQAQVTANSDSIEAQNRIISNSNESLTQEDLEEALDDTYKAIENLIMKCQFALKLIDTEIYDSKLQTFCDVSDNEKEMKFIIYSLIMELKSLIIIICQKDFINEMKDENLGILAEKIRKQQEKHNDYILEEEMEAKSLRIFSTQPKEIKFTQYFIQKLIEKFGEKLKKVLNYCFDFYLGLMDFMIDLGYAIEKIDINQIGEDMFKISLSIMQQAVNSQHLQDYETAKQKYQNASFILEELMRLVTCHNGLDSSSMLGQPVELSIKNQNQKKLLGGKEQDLELINKQPAKKADTKTKLKNHTLQKNSKIFTFIQNQKFKVKVGQEIESGIYKLHKQLEKRISAVDSNLQLHNLVQEKSKT
eukprot:403364843